MESGNIFKAESKENSLLMSIWSDIKRGIQNDAKVFGLSNGRLWRIENLPLTEAGKTGGGM